MLAASATLQSIYYNRTVAMCEHGRDLDGRTVAPYSLDVYLAIWSRAAGTGNATSCASGGGGGVAYEARGYKQGWADGRAGKTGKSTAQIDPKSRY